MRRDMDLIRSILLQAEQATEEQGRDAYLAIEGYDSATVARHVELLAEAGFVEAHILGGDGVAPQAARVFRLKWEGHDFLAAVRNDTVWAKTKHFLTEKGGAASLEVVKAIAVKYTKAHFGLADA